jgi:hypothetical protein
MTRKHKFSNPRTELQGTNASGPDPVDDQTQEEQDAYDATLPPAEDPVAALMAAESDGAPAATPGEVVTICSKCKGFAGFHVARGCEGTFSRATDEQVAALMMAEGEDVLATMAPGLSELLDAQRDFGIAVQAGRDVAGKPSTEDLEDLLAHYRLEPEHVAAWRGKPEEGLVVVTVGGEKITWPQDLEREIPRARLTGETTARPGRVFPDGYLRRDASKDPKDA